MIIARSRENELAPRGRSEFEKDAVPYLESECSSPTRGLPPWNNATLAVIEKENGAATAHRASFSIIFRFQMDETPGCVIGAVGWAQLPTLGCLQHCVDSVCGD